MPDQASAHGNRPNATSKTAAATAQIASGRRNGPSPCGAYKADFEEFKKSPFTGAAKLLPSGVETMFSVMFCERKNVG